MTRYLLDTGMMGHFINRRHGVDERARQARHQGAILGTCLPALGELFFGVENSSSRDTNMARLLRALSGIRCWPFDYQAAREFGRIAAELRRGGRMIQSVDIQIAAVAKTLGNCTVVSADTDFLAVSGLTVENWIA